MHTPPDSTQGRPHAGRAFNRLNRLARWCVLLALAASLALPACQEDAGQPALTPDLLDPDGGADAVEGDTSGALTDAAPDADTASPPDPRPTWPESRPAPNPNATPSLTPEQVGPPRADGLACDLDAKAAQCDSSLLAPQPAPTDARDLLFYVNRWNPISPVYPVSETSTWSPCDRAAPEAPNDLVCVPGVYTSGGTRRLGLREVAWESDAPAGIAQTWDGRAIGYQGKVGFKALMDAAAVEAGVTLLIASGYRSFATQRTTHEGHVQREVAAGYDLEEARVIASTYSARPGHSEHQLGTTADITFVLPGGGVFPGLEQEMGDDPAMRWLAENAHRFGVVMTYERHTVEDTQYIWEPWHFRFVGVDAADAMRGCGLNTESFLRARYQGPPNPPYAGDARILRSALAVEAHPTAPPGQWVRPGERVQKRWQVRNVGSVRWTGLTLTQVGGPNAQATPRAVACVLPGEAVILEADLTAPAEEGLVKLTFALTGDDSAPTSGGAAGDGALVALLRVSQEEPPPLAYRYVRVRDLSGSSVGTDPGADIDAIVVRKANGSAQSAAAVVAYQATPYAVLRADPTAALGPPAAFDAYPDVTTCRVDGGFVSLGGLGELIVELEGLLEPGDILEVLEVGACAYAPGQYAISERVAVAVSPTPDLDGLWVDVAEGVSPVISWQVQGLP
jgi:hypothetical protein